MPLHVSMATETTIVEYLQRYLSIVANRSDSISGILAIFVYLIQEYY